MNSALLPTFYLGCLPVYGDALLAPMDGFSDWPYRSICRPMGAALCYTEFVKAEFVVTAFERMQARMAFEENERPVVIQLYGAEPDELLRAALLVQQKRPDAIDLNLGCPDRRVNQGGAGVALMRQPLKVARLVRRLSAALEVPLTAKIRLGWADCRNYRLIARLLEENGAAAIAVHARTRQQGYSGAADWDAIGEVKAAVKIPVIGNGDVRTVADIERMKAHTGCEAVMIGRAAIGHPWIFARLDRHQVSPEIIRQMVHLHLQRNLQFYGERQGLLWFRKHALQYLKHLSLPHWLRTQIIQQTDVQAFLSLLDAACFQLQGDPTRLDAADFVG
ncbi:MAG: tRNA-dihydrouridine synthase family protein [Anaerolineales bacterium]